MHFEIDPLLFIADEHFYELSQLISFCTYKDKHLIIVDKQCFSTPNFKKLPQNIQDSIKFSFIWAINLNIDKESKKYVFVSVVSNKERAANIEQAIYLANRDFEILIENNANDRPFVESIIMNFSSKNSTLRKYKENGWLSYGNGGGCSNFINYIQGTLRQFDGVRGLKPNTFFLRIFAILDCDRLHEHEPINKYQSKNEAYFLTNNIGFHILERRCMENYLPDEALKEHINYPNKNKDWYDAYISLNSKQKQFLNFNKGLLRGSNIEFSSTTKFTDLPAEVQLLYSGISSANLNKLGIGLQLGNYKGTFPLGFEKPSANKSTYLSLISSQVDTDELKSIIDKIEQII